MTLIASEQCIPCSKGEGGTSNDSYLAERSQVTHSGSQLEGLLQRQDKPLFNFIGKGQDCCGLPAVWLIGNAASILAVTLPCQ